jgi:peptidoglycan/xylan/chitin deacetylase (PgdA/CDA1 family)
LVDSSALMTPGVLIILSGIVLLTILISPIFCRRFRAHGRILALHSLQPKFLDFGAASAKTLNHVMDGCRSRGLHIGTIEEAILREDTVAITFDDGYDDILQMLPLLGERRITITVFVPTAFIGKTNSWDNFLLKNKRRHLSEEQIKILAAAGVEFGSHSHRHRDLSRLKDDAIAEELRKSKNILEALTGKEVKYIAYPFGCGDSRVSAIARRLGYQAGIWSSPRVADVFNIGRTPLNSFDTQLTINAKLHPGILSGSEYLKSQIISYFSHLTPLIARFSSPSVSR